MKHGGLVHRVTMILPKGATTAFGYQYKKHLFFSYLKKKFGSRFTPQAPGPVAPAELIATEALMHADDLDIRQRSDWYHGSGYREAVTVLTMVEQYGCDIQNLRAVLEFGCGSGRVIRHLRNIDGLSLSGTDANPKPIAWNRENLSGIAFNNNELQPPLAYPDNSFDLIYALSVFTHIPLEWQRAWLDEMRRVLRPGGYLLCTVMGPGHVEAMLDESARFALQRDGRLTLTGKDSNASYSTQVLGSWDVFQTRDQVRKIFGENLELLCYTAPEAEAGQDTLILRKSSGPV